MRVGEEVGGAYRETPEEPSVRAQGALEQKVGKRTIPLFLFCEKQNQKREGIILIPVTFSLF